jgi:ring-1,2-phenylacetyl-CoA epoxidase subunit PaaB
LISYLAFRNIICFVYAQDLQKEENMSEINEKNDTQWDLWEVFIQAKTGAPHQHAGSVHATDAEMAVQNARDVYARRGKATSIWVVPSKYITATRTEDNEPFFDPADDKIFRYPLFYKVPKGVNIDVE